LIINNADNVKMLYSKANENNKSNRSLALADYLLFS